MANTTAKCIVVGIYRSPIFNQEILQFKWDGGGKWCGVRLIKDRWLFNDLTKGIKHNKKSTESKWKTVSSCRMIQRISPPRISKPSLPDRRSASSTLFGPARQGKRSHFQPSQTFSLLPFRLCLSLFASSSSPSPFFFLNTKRWARDWLCGRSLQLER